MTIISWLPHNAPWMLFIETVLQVVANLTVNFTVWTSDVYIYIYIKSLVQKMENGLLPVLHKAIMWTSAHLLSIRPSKTNNSEVQMQQFENDSHYFVYKVSAFFFNLWYIKLAPKTKWKLHICMFLWSSTWWIQINVWGLMMPSAFRKLDQHWFR